MDRLHALAFRGVAPVAIWERALERGRGAVVGAEGSGKTTLLLEVAHHARTIGRHPIWIQLRRDEPALSAEHRALLATRHDTVFVDGADLLGLFDRRWLAKRAGGPLLGTLHAPGWLPTLAHLVTSAALLDDLVRELCGASLTELAIDRDALYLRHRGNLRAALRDLYDLATPAWTRS